MAIRFVVVDSDAESCLAVVGFVLVRSLPEVVGFGLVSCRVVVDFALGHFAKTGFELVSHRGFVVAPSHPEEAGFESVSCPVVGFVVVPSHLEAAGFALPEGVGFEVVSCGVAGHEGVHSLVTDHGAAIAPQVAGSVVLMSIRLLGCVRQVYLECFLVYLPDRGGSASYSMFWNPWFANRCLPFPPGFEPKCLMTSRQAQERAATY